MYLTLITPISVPGVCGQPVVNAVFFSPSQQSDCMTSHWDQAVSLVNTRLVIREVRKDSEISFDRSIGHDLVLDLVHAPRHRVSFLSENLVIRVRFVVSINAHVDTFRCVNNFPTWTSWSFSMVLTGWNFIRLAAFLTVVQTASHETGLDPVLPRSSGEAAVATHATSHATGEQILGRDIRLELATTCNTCPVTHRFGCTKCPATSTASLVPDLPNGRTLWPLFPGIELLWNVCHFICTDVVVVFRQSILVSFWVHSK